MDENDVKILKAVFDLETDNLEKISDATGIARSTVHYRIDRMRESGIIKNPIWEIDIDKLGMSITVISKIYAEYYEDYHEVVGEKIANVSGVNKVYWTMGDTDFIAISHLFSEERVQELFREFESIDEVRRTSSTYVVGTIKDETNPLRDYPESELIELISDR